MSCWTVAASTGTIDEQASQFMVLGWQRRGVINATLANPDSTLGPDGADQNRPPIGGEAALIPPLRLSTFGREDAIVSLTNNAPKGVYSIRYHVPLKPVEFGGAGDRVEMHVRYLVDDPESCRVVVLLKKFNIFSPPDRELAETVAVFDSSEGQANDEFQVQSVRFSDQLDDSRFAYFIEALLINEGEPSFFPIPSLFDTSLSGPALAAIRLCEAGPVIK